MKTITMGPQNVPVIGQGTWEMGDDPRQRTAEVDALRLGIELGLTLIDTAEMYAQGGAERVVAQAIADCREQVYLVSKVWPTHASRANVLTSLKATLDRLQTSYLDLYLLHWPSRHAPLEETLDALADAKRQGLVRSIGVSNFPSRLLAQAVNHLGAGQVAANQIEYSLTERRPEKSLLAACHSQGIAVMAYSPVKHVMTHPGRAALDQVAQTYGVSPATVALAWVISHPGVVAIPKASRPEHIRANRAAAELLLSADDRRRLEEAFPAAPGEVPLQIL